MQGHVVIVGGGIAGLSTAYFLSCVMAASEVDSITLIESEKSLAYHTTGRSAALLIVNYGTDPIRELTVAGAPFLHDPPDGFADHPILTTRGILTVAEPSDHGRFEEVLAEGQSILDSIVELDHDSGRAIAPHVVFNEGTRAMWEPDAMSIDVAGLHQGYVRGARANGVAIETSRRADAARPDGDGWIVETTRGDIRADILVNAAGAWGDQVAERAGIEPIGLTPMRRTAFMVDSPFEGSADFPFVADALHSWYVGPDGRQFLCSPADETPTEPCDARPEEVDIALAIDRINARTALNIRSVRSSWAGQRTFTRDRSMVIGADPDQPSFIWCVGQGGTGIQTSPAAGQLTAHIVAESRAGTVTAPLSATVGIEQIDRSALAPGRLRHSS